MNAQGLLIIVVLTIVLIKIVLRQQGSFHVTNGLGQTIAEFVEILFVQVDFHLYKITVIVFAALTFGDGDVIVVVSGSFYIKKVSAFSCTYTL